MRLSSTAISSGEISATATESAFIDRVSTAGLSALRACEKDATFVAAGFFTDDCFGRFILYVVGRAV